MEFYTTSTTKRPIRLSARTRKWADLSMRGKYGDEAIKTSFLTIENEDFKTWNAYDRYDYAIEQIAKNAPLRVLDEELVCGSATLGDAIRHVIPARFDNKNVFYSVSHLTIDFETTLKKGVTYYEEQIKARMKDDTLSPLQLRFLESLLNVINALKIYHARYLEATKNTKPEVYKNLLQVPFAPARNFHEAVQSVWFIFSFVRLCGNWPGIGRIDYLLGSYLENDLKSRTLTLPKAREILASLFIKGTEWIVTDTPRGSGDAQHYQNIVLAGVDENGKEVTNKVTYLVLDIIEELGISDFPITVRINENTPKKLLEKVAKVIRHGGGVVAVYNEPLILDSMTKFGYDLKEARNFANDGCWEVQVPGKTNFGYIPFDSLALLQKVTLKGYENVEFDSFESLYNAYIADLEAHVCEIIGKCRKEFIQTQQSSTVENFAFLPTSVISLFENGCIENARSYAENGAVYNVVSPHIGGIADTVNSLYAIKKLVFDDKKINLSYLLNALKNNWENAEELRAYLRKYKFYGTDNNEVDSLYKRLLHDFYLVCDRLDKEDKPYRIPAGVSTFGREIDWLPMRLASAHGTKEGTILAGNTSPTPGTDTEGATAVIKSYCKADLTEMVTGAALDIKLTPRILDGENGVQVLTALIRSFISLGGFFLQVDTVSADTLKKAQENPQEYKTLSVRVSGWNARFITLTKEWQDMVIQRTEHNK